MFELAFELNFELYFELQEKITLIYRLRGGLGISQCHFLVMSSMWFLGGVHQRVATVVIPLSDFFRLLLHV